HRFFAIVDRSGLQVYAGNMSGAAGVSAGANQVVSIDPHTIRTSRGPAGASNATLNYAVGDVVNSAGVAYYCIQPNTNIVPTNTSYWLPVLQAGMSFEVDTGLNMEVVSIKSVNASQFTADFTLNHAAGVPILLRGNPGPQLNYNPRK